MIKCFKHIGLADTVQRVFDMLTTKERCDTMTTTYIIVHEILREDFFAFANSCLDDFFLSHLAVSVQIFALYIFQYFRKLTSESGK